MKKAACLLGAGYKVVERIVYYRGKDLQLPEHDSFPERFGIDEFANKKGKKDYCVAIASREKVAVVSMDMWNTFINLVEEFFPNAAIVIDRFHVMGQMNKVVDKIRKSVQKQQSDEDRKELKGLRWVVLKNNENLSCEEQMLLKKAFSCSEKLHKVYLRKEDFKNIMRRHYGLANFTHLKHRIMLSFT